MTGWTPPPSDPYEEAYRRAAIEDFMVASPGPAPPPRHPSARESADEVVAPARRVMRTVKLLGKLGEHAGGFSGDVQFDMDRAHELLRESGSGPSVNSWRNDENSPAFTQRMVPGDTSSNMDTSRAARTAISQGFDLDADGVDVSKTASWRRGYAAAMAVAFGKLADTMSDPLRAGTDDLRRGDGSEEPLVPDRRVVANPNTRMSTSQALRSIDNTPSCSDDPPIEEPLP